MAKRKRMSMKRSKRLFTKTAKYVNKKNAFGGTPLRGGIRL